MATQETLFVSNDGVPSVAILIANSPAMSGSDGAPVHIPIHDPGVDLARKTVCIKVRLSTMGNTRKVSTSQIEADADKALLRVSKHLLDSAELKAIRQFDGEIRRYLYNICLPFEIGIHLLPIAALQTVEDRLRQFAVDRVQLIDAFLDGVSEPVPGRGAAACAVCTIPPTTRRSMTRGNSSAFRGNTSASAFPTN